MVVKRRLLLSVPIVLSLALVATTAPTLGVFGAARPDPLSQSGIVRVHDIAVVRKTGGAGPVVALGWREAANPGQLYMTFSTDGGRTYRRANGTFRRFAVLGEGNRGISVDACGGRVWASSILAAPGDRAGDRDVLLSSRGVRGGGAGQAFVTSSSLDRIARDTSIACIGNRLLAIGWIETSGGTSRVKLMIRSLEPLGETPAVRRVLTLGTAVRSGGISVDASNDTVHVAWTANADKNLYHKRLLVRSGADPDIVQRPTRRLARGDIRWPQIGVRGNKVVLAYTDAGKVGARLSTDGGASFEAADTLVNTGGLRRPSRAYSADIAAQRVVVEVVASKAGDQTAQRVVSRNAGQTWDARPFGNVGARVGALRKTTGDESVLVEAWQNNASGPDTLRAQFER
jgi:hypothetical protein